MAGEEEAAVVGDIEEFVSVTGYGVCEVESLACGYKGGVIGGIENAAHDSEGCRF